MKSYKIAAIPGDGIGNEVVPEGILALEAAGRRFGFEIKSKTFDWSCELYAKTGRMMPEDGIAQLADFDAIFLGAVGFPNVPDHISLWGLLIPIRREFQQYVNLRPVKLFEGVPCPLAGRKVGDIDFMTVRENSEGEYSEIGGRQFQGTDQELAVQQSIFTKKASTASCAMPSSSPACGPTSTSRRRPSRMASSIPCRSGTNASRPCRNSILTSRPTSITSIS